MLNVQVLEDDLEEYFKGKSKKYLNFLTT
jgi:hypothetical protein